MIGVSPSPNGVFGPLSALRSLIVGVTDAVVVLRDEGHRRAVIARDKRTEKERLRREDCEGPARLSHPDCDFPPQRKSFPP